MAIKSILLSAKHPPGGARLFGGVQSWCETIADAFAERDIETTFWGPAYQLPERSFDLGIFANIAFTAPAVKRCAKTINLSHGIIPDERPHDDLDAWFTSEEIKDYWERAGAVIRQPIDCEFWSPANERRDLLLFYSYRAVEAFGLDALAEKLGLKFAHVSDTDAKGARDIMRRAALCCASGRSALEAMASGAPTMICDWRPYNGAPLIEPDLEIAMRFNYSGRGGLDARHCDLEGFAREAMTRGSLRDYVLENHDHRKIADQILSLV